jgi:RNA polymerase sigma-70 factor (ECF subfamily)
VTRLLFDLQITLSHCNMTDCEKLLEFSLRCHNPRQNSSEPEACVAARFSLDASPTNLIADSPPRSETHLATEQELNDFLKSVEKRAFKRSVYHVRNEEAALDIVQDSMMKLAEHYGDKPVAELPMLFQRILSNCTLDWFRRQKTRNALFSNMSDFESASEEGDFDLLETFSGAEDSQQVESAEDSTRRTQIFHEIEAEIKELPARQREAFLMRYWEEMDVAETAAAMGCSEGSVKTHCSRAVQALSKALMAKGIQP